MAPGTIQNNGLAPVAGSGLTVEGLPATTSDNGDVCHDPYADWQTLQGLCDGVADDGGEDDTGIDLLSYTPQSSLKSIDWDSYFNTLPHSFTVNNNRELQDMLDKVREGWKSLWTEETLKGVVLPLLQDQTKTNGWYSDTASADPLTLNADLMSKVYCIEVSSPNRTVRVYINDFRNGSSSALTQVINTGSKVSKDEQPTHIAIFKAERKQLTSVELNLQTYVVASFPETFQFYSVKYLIDPFALLLKRPAPKGLTVATVAASQPAAADVAVADDDDAFFKPSTKPKEEDPSTFLFDDDTDDFSYDDPPSTTGSADVDPSHSEAPVATQSKEQNPVTAYIKDQSSFLNSLETSSLLTGLSRDFIEEDAKPALDLVALYLRKRPESIDELNIGDTVHWSDDMMDDETSVDYVIVDIYTDMKNPYQEERRLALKPKSKDAKNFFIITETIKSTADHSDQPASFLLSVREVSLNDPENKTTTTVIIERTANYKTLLVLGSHQGESANVGFVRNSETSWLLTDMNGTRSLINDNGGTDAPSYTSAYKLTIPFTSSQVWTPSLDGSNLFLDGNNVATIIAHNITAGKEYWRPVKANGGAAVGIIGGWHSYNTPGANGYDMNGGDTLIMGRAYLDWNGYGNKSVTWSFLRPEVTLAGGGNIMGSVDPNTSPSVKEPGFPVIPFEGALRLYPVHVGGLASLPKLRTELQSWDLGAGAYVGSGIGFGQPFDGIVFTGTSDQPVAADNLFQGVTVGALLYYRVGRVQVEASYGESSGGVVTGEMKNYSEVENGIPVSGKTGRVGITFEL